MTLGIEVGLGPGHIVLEGDPAPLPLKGGRNSTQFSAHFYCGQTVGCIKMPLDTEVDLDPGLIVLDGDPAPPQKGGHSPPIFGYVYCDQTAGWIKMPLGMEVGLGPGVLDGDSLQLSYHPTRQKSGIPIFGPCLLWTNGCMHQDTTWYGGRPQPK